MTSSINTSRLKRDLSRDAIAFALEGEWERASEVNRALLELSENDVEAMNRLGKALMELGRYSEAKEVLGRVTQLAPYNNIAKKNLGRLEHLETRPASDIQGRKVGGAPRLFIEESGKSGTTLLRKSATGQTAARIAPGDPATLEIEHEAINVYTRDGDYLGQIEPKLGTRLLRLMRGGNRYEAAIIGVSQQGISIIIREVYRHRTLQKVYSFPTKAKDEHRIYLNESLARYTRDEDLDEEDEDGGIVEDELESAWTENE